MIKAEIKNGIIATTTKGSAVEMLAEVSAIVTSLHEQFMEDIGIVRSIQLLNSAVEFGIENVAGKLEEQE